MRNRIECRAAVAVLLGVLLAGIGAEPAHARYTRKSPIVEAVKKTRDSIVTLKVEKSGGGREVVGTGVVIDERGVVVTNRHVVAGAETITARLADGTTCKARLHLEAPNHDLAVLKLTAGRPLKALAFAPGSDLMVGETVIAVGNPFGYTNSVTTGIISALGREITMPGGVVLRNLIQVNASINPGNSGGPLLNINGDLIGINVAIREGAQGIAFALNSDSVQEVVSKLLSANKVANLSHGLVCRVNVPGEEEGQALVVVEAVAHDSPAARAGLKSGDVLTRLGELPVCNRFDVERALWNFKPGDAVEAVVLRNGEEQQVALTLDASGDAKKPAVAKKNTGKKPATAGYARAERRSRR
jgi:serine protease Do